MQSALKKITLFSLMTMLALSGVYFSFFVTEAQEVPQETGTLADGSSENAAEPDHDMICEDFGEAIYEETAETAENAEETICDDPVVILDVPYINQRMDYPNGCESVSAVMAMNYFGYDIHPGEFIDKYLEKGNSPYFRNGVRYGCDPHEKFPGDPRNYSGWGCYPEVIKKAIDKMYIPDITAVVLRDASLSTLCDDYIDNGIPVVFWGTIDMQEPSSYVSWLIEETEEVHYWVSPFHCLLLVGYDSENYYFNDPWQSKTVPYPKKDVEIAYNAIGRYSLVVIPDDIMN